MPWILLQWHLLWNTITSQKELKWGKWHLYFFNKTGVNLFYLCIAVYLYGDLAIYSAAVAESLRDVSCIYRPENGSCVTPNNTDLCWESYGLTRRDAYRIFLTIFLVTLGPFTFFNVQKTKYLQIFTTVMRWLAFGTMIALATIALIKGKGRGHPDAANLAGVPSLFGVCVYSFMCHHSLPSLITPIKDKSRLVYLLMADYVLILGFYSLLSFTGIYTFNTVETMYTLNFEPQNCNATGSDKDIIDRVPVLQYFLTLFPVVTLSTNFPIIAITLCNNLKSLFLKDNHQYSFFVERLLFPVLSTIPPVAIAFATSDLQILVGITGSYAGAVIQYVVPALLVYYARKDTLSSLGLGVKNKHSSPFKHTAWIIFVLLWAFTCIIFVTINHIITKR